MEVSLETLKNMTNEEYSRCILPKELPLIVRVATYCIDRKVGSEAPLWDKERAYDEWLQEKFDGDFWEKFRVERVDSGGFFEVENKGKNRSKTGAKMR